MRPHDNPSSGKDFDRRPLLAWLGLAHERIEQYGDEPNIAAPGAWITRQVFTPVHKVALPARCKAGGAALGVKEAHSAAQDFFRGGAVWLREHQIVRPCAHCVRGAAISAPVPP